MGWVGGAEGYVSKITSTGLESQFNTYTDWDAISFGSNDYGWTVSCFGRKMIYENNEWTFYGGAQYFPCYGDIQFNGPTQAWLSYGGEVLRLRDGTFRHFYEDTAQSIQGVFTLGLDTVWAVTTGGDILVTSQGNADTVHFSADHIADGWLTDIFAVDGHHAWAIGNNGSFYRYGVLEGFPSGDANMIDFVVDQEISPAKIDNIEKTVHVIVKPGTDLTQIIPEIYLSPEATVNPPGGIIQDFTYPVTYTVTSGNGQTVNDWIVTVNIASGEIEWALPEIILFPNPNSGEFRVSSLESSVKINRIEIIDLNSRKLLEKNFISGTETIELDISSLHSGLYFCRISSNKYSITKKLIIK
jgi:hypothetical protein